MSEAVARFRAASEVGDVEGMMAALAPAPQLVSPISGRLIFHGEGDLRVLLTAIYGTMRDVRWGPELGDGEMRVVLGEAKVARCGSPTRWCSTSPATGRSKPSGHISGRGWG